MNQTQFASYLSQGLGRPYIYLQNHDPQTHIEALLQACLYNPIYDRQCEGSRASYLYKLIQLTRRSEWFRQQLLQALAEPTDEMDLNQLFDFALIYARSGDALARQLLYEKAEELTSIGQRYGTYQLIDLDGVAGFLFIANCLGKAMQSNPELWEDNDLLLHLKSTGADTRPDLLCSAAYPQYPFVSFYLDSATRTQELRDKRPDSRFFGQPYSQFQHYIEHANYPVSPFLCRRWGEKASDDDLKHAARDLLRLADPRQLATYLSIFGKRVFPFGIKPLLPFVWSNQEKVARMSIQAISQFQHPTVRELGFAFIQAQHHVLEALELFIHNYQCGDDRFLATLLVQTEDIDLLHGVGLCLDNIFAAHPTSTADDIFLNLYERGPCSLCRERFVQRLVEINRIPLWMEEESRYDSNPNVYQVIKTHISG